MRHGERMDSKYGTSWYQDQSVWNNAYSWPSYRSNVSHYILDPPLTAVGAYEAGRVGRMLADDNNIRFDFCFSSPAIRCIQTAKCVLHGYQGFTSSVPIYVCNNLYECYGWMGGPYHNPSFMSINELKSAGLNCASTTDSFVRGNIQSAFGEKLKALLGVSGDTNKAPTNEDESSYYNRSAVQIAEIISIVDASKSGIRKMPSSVQNLYGTTLNCLIVGHAPTAEVLSVSLLGTKPNLNVLRYMNNYVNFLCMVIAERRNNIWSLNPTPLRGTSINHMQRI